MHKNFSVELFTDEWSKVKGSAFAKRHGVTRVRMPGNRTNPIHKDSPRLELCFLRGSISGMPTYEYHCQKCDKNFEMFQSMRDKPVSECPKELCRLPKWGHGKVKRLLGTGAGIIFKGSGFYITDYRSKDYREAAKKEAPTSATAEKTSGGKESKTRPEKKSSSSTKTKKESAE